MEQSSSLQGHRSLPSLVRHAWDASQRGEQADELDESIESIPTLFPDTAPNMHGDPGSDVLYDARLYFQREIRLSLPDPPSRQEGMLFAQYLWNASICLGELIGESWSRKAHSVQKIDAEKVLFDVQGINVLEVGAGTGLAGIVSALAGAKAVTISDFPSPSILKTLRRNVDHNITLHERANVSVRGHEWGDLGDELAKSERGAFERILCADCLWMDGEHENLISSMDHFLAPTTDARIWITAGFHTGRLKVISFLDLISRAPDAPFEIDRIWKQDTQGSEKKWSWGIVSVDDEVVEQKRWLVVAILKRKAARL